MTETKVWDKEGLVALLQTNDKAVCRALQVLYASQTAAEQCHHHTSEENGVGFSKVDSEILSSFAEFYAARGYLTPRQMELARKRVKKYWMQLLRAAAAKGAEVSLKVRRK